MPTYTLFVGGIGPNASLAEIEAEFMTFGKCICSFKGNFGFVEFEDRKQAKDAMLHVHGMKFSGERLGVDWKKQKAGGPEGDAWAPERRRGGGTARPSASEDYRRSNRERDRDRSRDRGSSPRKSYRSHRDSRDGRDSERRGGSFRSRSRDRDRDRYDRDRRERRSRSRDRGGKDRDRYARGDRGYPSRSRGRDRDRSSPAEARKRSDRDAGYRSQSRSRNWNPSRSRSRSRDRRRRESVPSRRTEHKGDYRTRDSRSSRVKSPSRRETRSDERRDREARRAERDGSTPDGSGGSSRRRSPGRGGDDDRAARKRGSSSKERRAHARDKSERGSDRNGSQQEDSDAFEDESGTASASASVTRRNRKRSRSRSRSRSRCLNGDGRPSDQSSRGVNEHHEKNCGVDEARAEREGGDADEGAGVARIDDMASPQTFSEEDEQRDESEAESRTDLSEGDENSDDEPGLSAEAMENMTLSELRKELKLRNLNFSGKRPALTKRLRAAMDS